MPAHSKAILKSIYYDPLDVLITTSVDKSIRMLWRMRTQSLLMLILPI